MKNGKFSFGTYCSVAMKKQKQTMNTTLNYVRSALAPTTFMHSLENAQTCIHTDMYTHTHTHTRTRTHTHMYTHPHYAYTHLHNYACALTHTHTNTHRCTPTHTMHTHTCLIMHVHTHCTLWSQCCRLADFALFSCWPADHSLTAL